MTPNNLLIGAHTAKISPNQQFTHSFAYCTAYRCVYFTLRTVLFTANSLVTTSVRMRLRIKILDARIIVLDIKVLDAYKSSRCAYNTRRDKLALPVLQCSVASAWRRHARTHACTLVHTRTLHTTLLHTRAASSSQCSVMCHGGPAAPEAPFQIRHSMHVQPRQAKQVRTPSQRTADGCSRLQPHLQPPVFYRAPLHTACMAPPAKPSVPCTLPVRSCRHPPTPPPPPQKGDSPAHTTWGTLIARFARIA